MSDSIRFTSLMVRSEANLLRRLHAMLEQGNINTRQEFTDVMRAAFKHGNLDPRALADDLGHSISAVYRWIDGISAPHPSLWPRIIQWVMAAIDARIDLIEEGESEPDGQEDGAQRIFC
jgi:hypothetical protein